jgi:hypothetical protein
MCRFYHQDLPGRRYATRHHQHSMSYLRCLKMNGCFNASLGVIRFSGLSAKHRSSRSVNKANSLVSISLRPFAADKRRDRMSRDGLEKARVLMVSCREQSQQIIHLKSEVKQRCWDDEGRLPGVPPRGTYATALPHSDPKR